MLFRVVKRARDSVLLNLWMIQSIPIGKRIFKGIDPKYLEKNRDAKLDVLAMLRVAGAFNGPFDTGVLG